MRLFQRKNKIHVEFIDQETSQVFAESSIPLENLPESFVQNTTIQLDGDNWFVVLAEPMHSSEFRQTRKLRLHLLKIDPSKILYILPTICDFLGEVDKNSKTTGNEFTLHEDNWRNIELVSLAYKNEISTEFKEIVRIYHEQRVGDGFQTLHLRKEIEYPFESASLPFDELANFEKARTFSGLKYERGHKLVKNGFAFSTVGGITWYGRQKNNYVQELCIAACLPNEQTEQDVEILAQIMDKYNLGFIDWCHLFFANSKRKDDLKLYFLQAYSGENNTS